MIKHLLLVVLILGALAACSDQVINDEITQENMNEVSPEEINLYESFIVVNPMSDAMDNGRDNLARNVVVDTDYYNHRTVSRGDIVYFEDNHISRVAALPNERMKITNGQIYINDAKLDTFYGAARIDGIGYKEFTNIDVPGQDRQALINEVFELNKSEMTVNSDAIFVIADDWFRGNNSTTFRELSKEYIIGKVVGVCTECSHNE